MATSDLNEKCTSAHSHLDIIQMQRNMWGGGGGGVGGGGGGIKWAKVLGWVGS